MVCIRSRLITKIIGIYFSIGKFAAERNSRHRSLQIFSTISSRMLEGTGLQRVSDESRADLPHTTVDRKRSKRNREKMYTAEITFGRRRINVTGT